DERGVRRRGCDTDVTAASPGSRYNATVRQTQRAANHLLRLIGVAVVPSIKPTESAMNWRLAWVVLVVGLGASRTVAADDSPQEYARVEVRGKLTAWEFAVHMKDPYALVIKGEHGGGTYHLILADDATRDAARELVGQPVVVTGDLTITTLGDGKRKETT